MQPNIDGDALRRTNRPPLSVLVVEDEAVIARDLERNLSDMGYEVIGAVMSGEEALRVSEEHAPDVVLMDIHISGDKDGIETAELLQKRHHVPIVYLTAYADEQTVARAVRTAPYGYLVKPFTTREVRSAIEVARGKYEMDRELARRELWFSTTLRSIGDAVVACDAERRVVFLNSTAETLTGWTTGEAIGRPVEEIVTLVEGPATMARVVDRAFEHRSVERIPPNSLLISRGSTGRPRAVEDCASAIVHQGSLLGAVIVLRDITEQEELRQRATMSERLAALGTLATGIAHEINNPLTFVLGNLYGLDRLIEDRKEVVTPEQEQHWVAAAKESVGTLREGARRVQRIVADVALFGHPSGKPIALVDVRESIEWALRMTVHQVRHRARVVTDFGPTPPVRASETDLGQVFVNLLVNAAHAIPDDGNGDHVVRVVTRTDQRGWAVVSVQDTGVGMSPDVLARIFDPFFTSKPPGKGTGLGLSICHRIVDAIGGQIRVRSSIGQGTSFDVCLPAVRTRVQELQAPSIAPKTQSGRVLVIDDDPNVLRSLARLIVTDHEVVTADGAKEAFERLEQDDRFDVVLCDLMMPHIDGEQFLRQVHARWPALESTVVFMTGGAFTPAAKEFLMRDNRVYIEKPFEPAALRQLLQDRLQARRAGRSKP